MGNPVVDVIVPVYRPDDKFYKLLQQLKQQTWPVHRIILMNTEKKFWDEFWKTREGLNMENLEVHHISKAEFDHGGTRNQGVSYSEADVIVLMTDDAVPEDDYLIANLVKGLTGKWFRPFTPDSFRLQTAGLWSVTPGPLIIRRKAG